FTGDADFGSAEFTQGADFHGATFSEGGNFIDTKFAGPSNFSSAEFLGRMFFASNDKDVPIFSGVEIDFRSVYINPLDVLIIHDADLRRCKFQGTDLRKAAITGVRWSPIPFSETFCRHLCLCQRTGTRFCRLGVYDEISPLSLEQTRSWSHIERQYRELKQNYEDRRDYERAGDFHYGEKEARRNKENRDTPPGLRLWLTLYWLVSGYGERYWRPLLWALVLLLVSTYCYIQWDLLHLKVKGPFADRIIHWWDAGLYSLRVMTLLKPSNFDPVLFWGHLIYVAQSLLGPLLLGLFALALRQRLKR
ncbi:MAG: pentapeptide repeat-containing protein, partial [Thermodesulfobacteriota bacterium]